MSITGDTDLMTVFFYFHGKIYESDGKYYSDTLKHHTKISL